MTDRSTQPIVRPARQRRGIVLIFVVVLLVLLAVMGTAYLAVSRADRLAITGRGAGLSGGKKPLLQDRTTFDRLFGEVQDRAKEELIWDLFDRTVPNANNGIAPTLSYSTYRTINPTTAGSYRNYIAYGTLTGNGGRNWLASLLPELYDSTNNAVAAVAQPATEARYRPAWPWISGPLVKGGTSFEELVYADPRDLATGTPFPNALNPANARRVLYPTTIVMPRASSDKPGPRMYPGLYNPNPAAQGTFIGADADGDGIADSYLVPIALNPAAGATSMDRFVDSANNCVYFYAVRIVDNSAQVNVNTALSMKSDYALKIGTASNGETAQAGAATLMSVYNRLRARLNDATANTIDQPNLGMYRSNVGLVELLDGLESYFGVALPASTPTGMVAGTPGTAVRQAEIDRIVNFRLPGLIDTTSSGTVMTYDAFNTGSSAGGRVTAGKLNTVPDSTNNTTATFLRTPDGGGMLFKYSPWQTAPGATGDTLTLQSVGDYLTNGLLRFGSPTLPWGFTNGSANPTGNLVATIDSSTTGMKVFTPQILQDESVRSLAVRSGSLLSRSIPQTQLESLLTDSTYYSAPNFNSNQSNPWAYFAPNEAVLWYNWTKDTRQLLNAQAAPAGVGYPGPASVGAFNFSGNPATFNDNTSPRPDPDPTKNFRAVKLLRSLRSLLTLKSGVMQKTAVRGGSNPTVPTGMAGYGTDILNGQYPPMRVSAATAPFRALWRGYWHAMTQANMNARSGGNAFSDEMIWRWGRTASQVTNTPTSMFSLTSLATDTQRTAILRAAIAAANTIAYRKVGNGVDPLSTGYSATDNLNDRDIPAFDVTLDPTTRARVYGVRPQPFITEFICSPGNVTDTANTSFLYIELYNPFPFPIDLSNYRLATITRKASVAATAANQTQAATTSLIAVDNAAGVSMRLTGVIPPNGFVVVGDPDPAVAGAPVGVDVTRFSPAASATTRFIPASLAFRTSALTREVGLFRTRRGDGVAYQSLATQPPDRILNSDETVNTGNEANTDQLTLAPIDLIDLRPIGGPLNVTSGADRPYFEYRRPTCAADGTETVSDRWRCVYAGPMQRMQDPDGTLRPKPDVAYDPAATTSRQRNGTLDVLAIRDSTANTTSTTAVNRGTLGGHNPDATKSGTGAYTLPTTGDLATTPGRATFLSPVINLWLPNSAGITTAGAFKLPNTASPFGTPFARDGDLLNVPFIGSYVIEVLRGSTWVPVEVVPISLDAVAADNVELQTPINPSVGRFDPAQLTTSWATDLNDFVTARDTSAQVLLPDVPQLANGTARLADAPTQGAEANNPAQVRWITHANGVSTATNVLNPIDLTPASPPTLREGTVNVNTAPAQVLRLLPFRVTAQGQVDLVNNAATADAAVQLLNAATPGKFDTLWSLRDLVVGGQKLSASLPAGLTTAADFVRVGDITPDRTGEDLLDYKRPSLNVTRISNVATTRSDTFTVYITVQAWSYVGANQATETRLIGERRSAFIVDRSTIGPTLTGATMSLKAAISDLNVISVEQE
ncbi:MAG: hypothetical protein QM770_22925 [Tepidisphaeraceae bacterium]